MRGKISVFCVLAAFICLFVLNTGVQAQEKTQQFYFVEDAVVKIAKFGQYEDAIKKMVEAATKVNFAHPWYAYSTQNYHYYFVFPAKDAADVQNLFDDWYKMVEEFGPENWQPINELSLEAVEYYEYGHIHHRPDLSFVPEDQPVTAQEAPFTYWGFCYTLPGHEKEMEDIFKEWVALYKENKFPSGFDTYTVAMGMELPCIFYVERAKDPVDLFSKGNKNYEIAGKEIEALWTKTLKLCRKYEFQMGMFRPELSYMPEQK
jgi:hypothetical protein